MTLDRLFLSLHVVGALMWIGSLFAVIAFLEAYAGEPEAAPRERLLKHLRTAAIVPDVGATVAMLFGAHWLFKFKLYEMHYMHFKLALVVLVIALHAYVKRLTVKAKKGEPFKAPPPFLKPMLSLTVTGIVIFVISKVPI